MAEGDSGGGARRYLGGRSPLRAVAIVVALAGAVLVVSGVSENAGVYVLAGGLLLAGIDDVRKGDSLDALFVVVLALFLVSDHENWGTVFWIAAVAILASALVILVRELLRHRSA